MVQKNDYYQFATLPIQNNYIQIHQKHLQDNDLPQNYINFELSFKLYTNPMPFIRKRDLAKKHNTDNTSPTLNPADTTHPQHSQESEDSHSQACLENLLALQDHVGELSVQNSEKQTAECLAYFLDNKRTLSIASLLQGYRQSLTLVGRWQQDLRKKGQQLNEQNASLLLGLLRRVVEELVRLTQDDKNDSAIQESLLHAAVFLNLEVFVGAVEGEVSRSEKRPSLMRKNSLKKVEELPPVRPSSRGKLSSLPKKEIGSGVRLQPVGGRPGRSEGGERTTLEQIIGGLCAVVKNLSANSRVRRELLRQQYLRLLNRYLCIWNDKNLNNTGNLVLTQLSAAYRHLAVQEQSYRCFLTSNCVDSWARLIQVFPTNQDLIFNVLRTLSKLSSYEAVCVKLNQRKACLKSLSEFFKFYKASIHIIIRIAIVFANMTSYLTDIRSQLYYDFKAWRDVYECFQYYAGRELSGRNQADKLGLSMAAWDYQHIKKQSDIDCAIRIIRLIANLFTVGAIGQDIYINDSNAYRQLIKKLKNLLQRKSNIERSSELIATILSCLTNVLYYDKEILLGNQQHRTVKTQLITVLVDFVVQIDHEEICCESLRVIANLTRIKQFCAAVVEAKIHQALLILLDSTSKEIVYYCLGVLSNLMADNNFKQQFKEPVITSIIANLNQCDNDDFDIVALSLKTLATIIDARNENIEPRLLTQIENCLMNLGSHCDKVSSSITGTEMADLHESRSLINLLLNSMPQQRFVCSVKNCGRRFADEAKLAEHVKRRHKA